jgi:hypothetical protein
LILQKDGGPPVYDFRMTPQFEARDFRMKSKRLKIQSIPGQGIVESLGEKIF